MNTLLAMEVFVQVVDAGGFTRAAENMQLPKASVSTLVQGLETALAVKLLHRTTRQISVTADGAAYYERCLRILSDVREAEESLSRTKLSPSGRLRVDAPTGLAREVLVPALPDFFERYPDITLELGCSDRPVDLIEEGVDCAVRGGVLGDSALIARRIGVLSFVTCAAPAYFPAVRVGRRLYADGGLYAVAPDQVALHELEQFLHIDMARVRMLSVGTATSHYRPAEGVAEDAGAADWLARGRLLLTLISVQQQHAHVMVEDRLGDERYLRLDALWPSEAGLGIDVATKRAAGVLTGLARKTLAETPPERLQAFIAPLDSH